MSLNTAGIALAGSALAGLKTQTLTHPAPVVVAPNPAEGNVYLSFLSTDFDGSNQRAFQALVGENGPVITSGYARWNQIQRPLMRDMAVFAGYDLAEMTVEIIMGRWSPPALQTDIYPGWQTGYQAGHDVEADCYALDWMAGTAAHYMQGPPQVVNVIPYSNQGGYTNMIPGGRWAKGGYIHNPYQKNLMQWVIKGLSWGKALRNDNGDRIYQEATIVFLQYKGYSSASEPNQSVRGGWFISKAGVDTAEKIAAAPSSHSPNEAHHILAHRIIGDAKNRHLKLHSIKALIKHKTAVWVPQHVRGS